MHRKRFTELSSIKYAKSCDILNDCKTIVFRNTIFIKLLNIIIFIYIYYTIYRFEVLLISNPYLNIIKHILY